MPALLVRLREVIQVFTSFMGMMFRTYGGNQSGKVLCAKTLIFIRFQMVVEMYDFVTL